MQLAIYRSATHTLYPEEDLYYCYAFEPIAAVEHERDGLLMDWTSDSGSEPFAVIEIPDGCEVTNNGVGWLLLIPDESVEISADDVYDLAVEHYFGLSVIQEPRCHAHHPGPW
jgi:hypothetical protein